MEGREGFQGLRSGIIIWRRQHDRARWKCIFDRSSDWRRMNSGDAAFADGDSADDVAADTANCFDTIDKDNSEPSILMSLWRMFLNITLFYSFTRTPTLTRHQHQHSLEHQHQQVLSGRHSLGQKPSHGRCTGRDQGSRSRHFQIHFKM